MATPFSKKPAPAARPSPPPVITPPETPAAKAEAPSAPSAPEVIALPQPPPDAKALLRELLAATPHDLARAFSTPEAYERYLKARVEAQKHV